MGRAGEGSAAAEGEVEGSAGWAGGASVEGGGVVGASRVVVVVVGSARAACWWRTARILLWTNSVTETRISRPGEGVV